MKLIINRKYWLHGEGSAWSCLYRENDKKMCCLGSLGTQRGIPSNCFGPSPADGVNDGKHFWPKGILTRNSFNDSSLCRELMSINDSTKINNLKREEELTKFFKKN